MPVLIQKEKNGWTVRTPTGVKAKSTSLLKAKRQKRLLNAIEHGWKPKKKTKV